MFVNKVPKSELTNRMNRFILEMDNMYSDWEMCAIVGDMSMYYLTGTICDGLLLIKRNENATLWVRKSFERAILESEFENIRHMTSFRDISNSYTKLPDTLYVDMSAVTMAWYSLLNKYMKFNNVLPVDNVMLNVRAIKSTYELEIMKRAGIIIEQLLIEKLPQLLYSDISEAELGADLYSLFVKSGYHGVSRFSMKNTDVVLGHIAFAQSSLYPSIFNGASGIVGLCPAAPVLGSRSVKLKEGDLLYIDIGFGIDGYNVDKTLVYSFKRPQAEYVNDVHHHCLELEKNAVSMMRPGAIPSEIYFAVCESVLPELRNRFMGAPGRTVRFLGHGVGLFIDEAPVIAKGFDKPLECGMTIAIEPKIGIDDVGMVGSENTYLITESGAISITGTAREILYCK